MPELQYMKFLPDGRLVPGDALGGALGDMASLVAKAQEVAGKIAEYATQTKDQLQQRTGQVATTAQDAAGTAVQATQETADWVSRWGVISLATFGATVLGAILAPSGHRFRVGLTTGLAFGAGGVLARNLADQAGDASGAPVTKSAGRSTARSGYAHF